MIHEWYDDIPNAQATPEMAYKYAHRYDDDASVNTLRKTGIKIIKNNYGKNNLSKPVKTNPKTVRTHCDYCNSELELTEEDTYIGWLGARFIKCPCCGKETMVDELDGIDLTKDNIKFPTHFYRTNKDLEGVKEIEDEEIVKEIRHGIDFLRENKDEFSWYISYGDLFVVVFRFEGDEIYSVYVT